MSMRKIEESTGVLLLTVPMLPDNIPIKEYLGVVSGEGVIGANIIKDFWANVADTTGGRVQGYESAIRSAVKTALQKLAEDAASMGANAVIAISVQASSTNGKMFMATAIGTAVSI